MPAKRLRVNGFWLFVQMKKRIDKIKGPFKDFVPIAEPDWESMTEDQKQFWKGLASGFKKTSLFMQLKELHKRLQKTPGNEELNNLKHQWSKLLEGVFIWVLVSFGVSMKDYEE